MRFRPTVAVAVALLALAGADAAHAQAGKPPLTMASHGGAFTKSQMLAYVQPYREETQRWVAVEDYDGGLGEIRRQVRSANPVWDVVTLGLPEAIAGCAEGLLEPIDPAILAPAPDGTAAAEDFYAQALQPCAIGFDVFATVVAYDAGRYDAPPATLADFFDLERFPGGRALEAGPQVNLEWALIADGVEPAQVYELLSTDAGLDRAFGVLERIRDDVSWWRNGDEPPHWLATGQVAMSSAWSGRIFEEARMRGSDLGIVWDHQVWNADTWAVVRGAVNREEAMEFIAFATTAERMAKQADVIAYGPTRRSAEPLVDAAVEPHLPTAPERRDDAIRIDYAWWAERQAAIGTRFERWLRGEDKVVLYDFDNPDGN